MGAVSPCPFPMKKLLLLCPSRGRSERIKPFLDSIEKTCNFENTRLQILLDKDDKDLGNYFKVLPSWAQIKVFDRKYDNTLTTEILNRAFKQDDDYEFYSVTNDDMVYLTPGWDEKLCVKGKIYCGVEENALKKYGTTTPRPIDPHTFPYTSCIDGDIVRALGWIQYPKLRHSAGDNIWYWIGRRMNVLFCDESVRYVHRSAYFNDGEADDTFNKTNSYNNIDDFYIYKDWLKYKCVFDIAKIKEKLCQTQHMEPSPLPQTEHLGLPVSQ